MNTKETSTAPMTRAGLNQIRPDAVIYKRAYLFLAFKETKRPKTSIPPMRVITNNHLLSLSSFSPFVLFLPLLFRLFSFFFLPCPQGSKWDGRPMDRYGIPALPCLTGKHTGTSFLIKVIPVCFTGHFVRFRQLVVDVWIDLGQNSASLKAERQNYHIGTGFFSLQALLAFIYLALGLVVKPLTPALHCDS